MKANGSMEWRTEKVNSYTRVGLSTKGNGKMTCKMEMDTRYGRMGQPIRFAMID